MRDVVVGDDLILVCEIDGAVRLATGEGTDAWGWPIVEIPATWPEMVHRDDWTERWVRAIEEATAGPLGMAAAYWRIRRREGGWTWIEGRFLRSAGGEIIVKAQDVAGGRYGEDAGGIRKSALYDGSADTVLIQNGDGQIRWTSLPRESMAEEGTDELDITWIHPEDQHKSIAAFLDAVEAGPGGCARGKVRMRNDERGWRWLELHHVNRLDDPTVKGVVTSIRDVTDETETELIRLRAEAMFETLVEHSSDLVALVDDDGWIRYLNPVGRRMFGWSANQLQHVLELSHPDDWEAASSAYQELMAGDADGKLGIRAKNIEGEWRYLELRGSVRMADTSIGGIVLTARDVTDERHAQEALEASEAYLRQLVDALPLVICRVELDGTISRCEGKFPDAPMLRADAALGRNVFDFDEPAIHEAFRAALAGDTTRAIVERIERSLETTYAPLIEDDTIVAVLAVVWDISAQRDADEARRASETLFHTAFDASPIGLTVGDADGTIVAANAAYCEIVGRPLEEIVGRTWIDLLAAPNDLGLYLDAARSVLEGKKQSFELPHPLANGEMGVVEVRVVRLDGERGGYVSHVLDVTEARRSRLAIENLNDELAARVAELNVAQDSTRQLVAELEEAREAERRRVAIGLHDDTVQALVGTRYFVEQMIALIDQPGELESVAERVRVSLDATIRSVRSMIFDLHPLVLDEQGLVAAIESTLRNLAEFGLQTHLESDFDGRLDTLTEDLAFRCVQQALANVHQHSEATEVFVSLSLTEGSLSVIVEDNGIGIDECAPLESRPGHIGLPSMRETLLARGGSLDIETAAGGGARLVMDIPGQQDGAMGQAQPAVL